METSRLDNLRALIGHEVGTSPWMEISQQKLDGQGALANDNLWIHIDRERAKRETPFGSTIAQGFLLLSHLTDMARSMDLPLPGVAYWLSYGFDRVRMVQPVAVDSRIRGRFELKKVEAKGHHGVLVHLDASIEIEGDDIAPAVVAEWLLYLRLED